MWVLLNSVSKYCITPVEYADKPFGRIVVKFYPPRHSGLWEKFVQIVCDLFELAMIDDASLDEGTRDWLIRVSKGKPPIGTLSVSVMRLVNSEISLAEEFRTKFLSKINVNHFSLSLLMESADRRAGSSATRSSL
ncbi:hypothetical protein TKK_0003697 [Trichogramma kaykai]